MSKNATAVTSEVEMCIKLMEKYQITKLQVYMYSKGTIQCLCTLNLAAFNMVICDTKSEKSVD
jgi:hypothetical protein